MTIVQSTISYHGDNQSQSVASILATAFRQISKLFKQQFLQKEAISEKSTSAFAIAES